MANAIHTNRLVLAGRTHLRSLAIENALPHDAQLIVTMSGMIEFDSKLQSDGFLEVDRILTRSELSGLLPRVDDAAPNSAGDRRMLDHGWCRELARQLLNTGLSRGLVAGNFVGVLCTYFDKSAQSNWGVAPHRDLAVPARSRVDIEGWKNWTVKQRIPHAHAPRALLERLFSIRLNLDHSSTDNGALMVAPGSHLTDDDRVPDFVVEGRPGDGVLLSPLTIHASRKSISGASRRVLHFLYGPREIRYPLEWFYAV